MEVSLLGGQLCGEAGKGRPGVILDWCGDDIDRAPHCEETGGCSHWFRGVELSHHSLYSYFQRYEYEVPMSSVPSLTHHPTVLTISEFCASKY